MERSDCGRRWIDYNKQIKDLNHICDENTCGIWATSFSNFFSEINEEECKERYGKNFMLLKTINDGTYIKSYDYKTNTFMEIIGNKFDVILTGSIENEKDMNKLKELLMLYSKNNETKYINEYIHKKFKKDDYFDKLIKELIK